MTIILKLDPDSPEQDAVERAARVIRRGGLVAFPTETVYGLGADAMSEQAIKKIFEAKGRPADNPLIAHVAGREMLSMVAAEVSAKAGRLIERFWPGPLTLVLERADAVAESVSAGLPTVAARMPKNNIALELIRRAQTPVAAPSANISGRPSPTCAEHVAVDLEGRIDMILDGGATSIGIESTVLDMTTDPPLLLRPGWITSEAIEKTIGPIEQATTKEHLKRSPGTRHRHYSPRARVVVVEKGSPEFIRQICEEFLETGAVGFIGHTKLEIYDTRFNAFTLQSSAEDYARSIYSALRQIDDKNPRVIVVEAISESGEGAAVMDRLRRAASRIIVKG